MPYIDEERREPLDPTINELIRRLNLAFFTAGDLNYVITRIFYGTILQDINYANINDAIGILECAKLELYRRLAIPYENKKIEQNGDVYN